MFSRRLTERLETRLHLVGGNLLSVQRPALSKQLSAFERADDYWIKPGIADKPRSRRYRLFVVSGDGVGHALAGTSGILFDDAIVGRVAGGDGACLVQIFRARRAYGGIA